MDKGRSETYRREYEERTAGLTHGDAEACLWDLLIRMQGQSFVTSRGLLYRYEIRGGEMFIDRKEKSITKATVLMAYRRALAVQAAEGGVSGPKKLGTFGASYLYPIFLDLGVCKSCAGRRRTAGEKSLRADL